MSAQNKSCFIGLNGPIGSGKDTVADYLVEKYGFKKMGFSDALKDVCAALFNVKREFFDDRIAKEQTNFFWGISPRQMLQKVGTDIVRNHLNGNQWIDVARLKVCREWSVSVHPHVDRWVFTDVRFQNEIDYIQKEEKGWIIHIERPVNPLLNLVKNKTHASELQALEFNPDRALKIYNDSTKENLLNYVDTLMKDFIQIEPVLIQFFNPKESK